MLNTSFIVLLIALLLALHLVLGRRQKTLVFVARRDFWQNKMCQKLVGVSKKLYLCHALCAENMKICMKKLYFLLFAAMAWGSALAQDNAFYFTDAALMPGTTTNIELCMRNSATDLTCLEAEIQLPEGLNVVLDEDGNPVATLYRNRTTAHEILTNVLDNGNLKLLISSFDGNLFGGEEGPLLSFCVEAAEDAPTGEYQVETVGESLLVTNTAAAYYSVGVTGNVLITDDPTGLEAIENGKLTMDNAIYNLAGQRLNKKQRGINIVGGRKELHK